MGGWGRCLTPGLPSGFPSSLPSSCLPTPSPGPMIGAPCLSDTSGLLGWEKARHIPPWELWSKPQGGPSQIPHSTSSPTPCISLTWGVSVFYFFVTVICITLKTHDSSFELENKTTPSLQPVHVSLRKWLGEWIEGGQGGSLH